MRLLLTENGLQLMQLQGWSWNPNRSPTAYPCWQLEPDTPPKDWNNSPNLRLCGGSASGSLPSTWQQQWMS